MVLPSHGFIQQQQRGQASFPFGTSLQQHPPSQAHQPTQSSLAHATAQQQQPGAGATTSSLPPHLQGGAAGGGGGGGAASAGQNDALYIGDLQWVCTFVLPYPPLPLSPLSAAMYAVSLRRFDACVPPVRFFLFTVDD